MLASVGRTHAVSGVLLSALILLTKFSNPVTEAVAPERSKSREAGMDGGRSPGRESDASGSRERDRAPGPEMEQVRAPKSIERDIAL